MRMRKAKCALCSVDTMLHIGSIPMCERCDETADRSLKAIVLTALKHGQTGYCDLFEQFPSFTTVEGYQASNTRH
jgi:hypothetical protein